MVMTAALYYACVDGPVNAPRLSFGQGLLLMQGDDGDTPHHLFACTDRHTEILGCSDRERLIASIL
jgi:hypothetical protein